MNGSWGGEGGPVLGSGPSAGCHAHRTCGKQQRTSHHPGRGAATVLLPLPRCTRKTTDSSRAVFTGALRPQSRATARGPHLTRHSQPQFPPPSRGSRNDVASQPTLQSHGPLPPPLNPPRARESREPTSCTLGGTTILPGVLDAGKEGVRFCADERHGLALPPLRRARGFSLKLTFYGKNRQLLSHTHLFCSIAAGHGALSNKGTIKTKPHSHKSSKTLVKTRALPDPPKPPVPPCTAPRDPSPPPHWTPHRAALEPPVPRCTLAIGPHPCSDLTLIFGNHTLSRNTPRLPGPTTRPPQASVTVPSPAPHHPASPSPGQR